MAIELIQNATAEYENHPTGGQTYTLDWTRQVFGPIGIVGIIFNLLIVITVSKLEMNKGSAITSSFRGPNKGENFTTFKLISHMLISNKSPKLSFSVIFGSMIIKFRLEFSSFFGWVDVDLGFSEGKQLKTTASMSTALILRAITKHYTHLCVPEFNAPDDFF